MIARESLYRSIRRMVGGRLFAICRAGVALAALASLAAASVVQAEEVGQVASLDTAPGAPGRNPDRPTKKGQPAEHPKISLLGDGYAQIVQLKDTAASVGIGLAFESPVWEGSFFVKKGNVDTVSGDRRVFGQSVLSPSSANVNASLLVRGYPIEKWRKLYESVSFGFAFAFNGGSTTWSVPDPALPSAPPLTRNAFVYTVSAGTPLRLWPSWLTANSVRVVVTPSLALHQLSGDVGADKAFREATIGTSSKTFVGVQAEMELRINEVFANATVSQVWGHVPGLTGGQLVVAIGFRGGIDLGKEIASNQ